MIRVRLVNWLGIGKSIVGLRHVYVTYHRVLLDYVMDVFVYGCICYVGVVLCWDLVESGWRCVWCRNVT